MRNYCMIFSIVSIVILLFGGTLSFFVNDPILGKTTIFVFGLLVSVSLISLAKAQPSPFDKLNEDHYRQSVVEDLYNRMNTLEDRLEEKVSNIRYDQFDLESRMIEFENSKKK